MLSRHVVSRFAEAKPRVSWRPEEVKKFRGPLSLMTPCLPREEYWVCSTHKCLTSAESEHSLGTRPSSVSNALIIYPNDLSSLVKPHLSTLSQHHWTIEEAAARLSTTFQSPSHHFFGSPFRMLLSKFKPVCFGFHISRLINAKVQPTEVKEGA